MGVESEIARLSNAGVVASASFTPAAAAYGAGDIIGTPQEFVFRYGDGRAVRQGALIRIITSVVKIAETALISGEASYSLPLFGVTPPSAQADNDLYTLGATDLAAYRGLLALGLPVDLGGACYVKTQYSDQQDFNLIGNSLFGRLVTAGAFTAAAVDRQVLLYGFEI
jgi:hypothetical protein